MAIMPATSVRYSPIDFCLIHHPHLRLRFFFGFNSFQDCHDQEQECQYCKCSLSTCQCILIPGSYSLDLSCGTDSVHSIALYQLIQEVFDVLLHHLLEVYIFLDCLLILP